jgi:threonine/homoserine/homoserine lactone efflux protein
MELSFNMSSIMALFAAMAVLAAAPSVSVLAVTARSASCGFVHGALTTAGIVLGDIVFILLAVFGLVLLVDAMGPAFVLVEYAGAAYLVWLSVLIWRSGANQAQHRNANETSCLSSFVAGLLITLGDQKAVLFYLGFLPAFLDLSALTRADIALVVGVAIFAVGGVKLGYAYAAEQAGHVLGGKLGVAMNVLTAIVMLVAAVWVLIRA